MSTYILITKSESGNRKSSLQYERSRFKVIPGKSTFDPSCKLWSLAIGPRNPKIKLCTFNNPSGSLGGINNLTSVEVIMDDILVCDSDDKEHDQRLHQVL